MEARALTRVVTRRRAAIAAGVLLLAAAALVDISIVEPRVHVRWRDDVSVSQRAALEQRYRLEAAEPIEGTTWRYELLDPSPENVGALVADPNVADTAYIDRETLAVAERDLQVSLHRVGMLVGPEPSGLVQPQTVLLVALGAALLWAAGMHDERRRRRAALIALLATGIAAYALPLRQAIAMGDSTTYVQGRASFEGYTGVHQIRFEAHLSHAILARLDAMFGRTADAPSRALDTLMRAATAWFLGMALLVGFVERWSPVAVRYLALAVIGPATLLYFGYRELGHLSLNLATFPLLVRGVRDGSRHLEASGVLAGLGTALHGFGLLSMAGVVLAAAHRPRALVRFVPWGVAAYLGWVAIYAIVLELPIVPGHAEAIPLRPWEIDTIVGERLNAAVLSARGVRDVVATALVVGMPLLATAAGLRRRFPVEARAALLYAIPSVAFVVMFWPIQGLAVEMDLVFAAFPAVYALAWVCAHDRRRAIAAAVVLACAHVVFWRIVLDTAFVNSRNF